MTKNYRNFGQKFHKNGFKIHKIDQEARNNVEKRVKIETKIVKMIENEVNIRLK